MKKTKNHVKIPPGVIPKTRPELPPKFVSTKINKEYWATFRFYDSKGRRLSIFGRPSRVDHSIIVTVLQLSNELNLTPSDPPYGPGTGPADRFDKARAKEIYETECMVPGIMSKKPGTEFTFALEEGETFSKAVVRFARERYYIPVPKQVTVYEFHQAKLAPKPVKKEKKDTYTVYIKNAGPSKLNIVKCVKDITHWGLKEAKEAVDATPGFIDFPLPKKGAEQFRDVLLSYGAEAEIQ